MTRVSPHREVHTKGIIINRFSSGEGSVRVHIFTESLGLVGALAKSAREERSKLRPHLTVGTFGSFDLVQGRETWRVTGAVGTIHSYFSLIGNPAAQDRCARVLSLLRQLVRGEECDEALFSVVWHFLIAVGDVPQDMLVHAERLVVLQILAALGYVSKEAVPDQANLTFSLESLQSLMAVEVGMRGAIQEGFVASGLL